jgi:hypothetical protein
MAGTTDDKLKGRPATLDRWPGERRDLHRALLLYAMQAHGQRSMRAVARALGVSDGSVRNWRRSGCWDARLDGHGTEADGDALDLYRVAYMADFGQLEVPHVAQHVVQPLGSLDLRDPDAQAAHEAAQRAASAVSTAQAEVEQSTAQAVADHRRDSREVAERHIKLVDGALGVIARRLKADEVRVSVRDIPLLVDCRARLEDVVSGNRQQQGRPLVESARLQYAKETGGDVVAAMHEDALELVAILGALRSTDGVDPLALAAADAEARGEAVHG